jgi:hypothetical protein
MIGRELIDKIIKLGGLDKEIIIMTTDPTDYTYKVPIEDVLLGDSVDSNGFSLKDINNPNNNIPDDEDEYVLIDIGIV